MTEPGKEIIHKAIYICGIKNIPGQWPCMRAGFTQIICITLWKTFLKMDGSIWTWMMK